MTTLINIVHPYSYKMKRSLEKFKLIYGSIEEFEERDRKVVEFVRTALDLNIKILRHEFPPKGTINYMLQHGSISADPIYEEILFDEGIQEVVTLDNGKPIFDKKPEEMSEKIWKKFNGLFVSDSELKKLIGNPDRTFYIGGFFEGCVRNMAYHQIRNYTPDKEVFCVEELCASINDKKTQEVRENIKREGIKIITYEEAIELLQDSN